MLEDESVALINPINEYTKQTIKAFITYMVDVISPKCQIFECNGENYLIYKYSSGKIIVNKKIENDEEEPIKPAKPIIKKKLNELDSATYNDDTMTDGTTRSLGAKLYKLLSKTR